MAHAYRMTWAWALGLTLVTFILWPLLALPAGAPWSLGYFTFWVRRQSTAQHVVLQIIGPSVMDGHPLC